MVEKSETREKTPAASTDVPKGPDQILRGDPLLIELPDGLPALPTIQDDLATELLELAERQVTEARKKLGPQASKPKLKRIEALFYERAGRAPKVSEETAKFLRGPATVQQTAVLDAAFDRSVATAMNVYDKSSIQSGALVQSAYDDWNLAVRIYRSQMRSAGAVLVAEIEAARHPAQSRDYEEYDEPMRGGVQVHYYAKAAKIGQSILEYEKTMQKAGAALAGAYGQLTTELYAALNTLAVAEATLISANQTAYSTFWTGMQTAMGQTRN